jgi:acyl-CoA reductase-like NAD-dependent aldehyde dehydrogenase
MADRFDAHAEELGTLVTKENGKKIAEGLLEGAFPGPTLRHTAAQALTDTGISAEVAPGQWFSTYAEPAGVVGIIVPWNSPVALLIQSLAPALSAGNTVAVKMPGQTALVANLVAQIIAEVSPLPRGRSTTASPKAATSRAASAACAAPSLSPNSRKPRRSSTRFRRLKPSSQHCRCPAGEPRAAQSVRCTCSRGRTTCPRLLSRYTAKG